MGAVDKVVLISLYLALLALAGWITLTGGDVVYFAGLEIGLRNVRNPLILAGILLAIVLFLFPSNLRKAHVPI